MSSIRSFIHNSLDKIYLWIKLKWQSIKDYLDEIYEKLKKLYKKLKLKYKEFKTYLIFLKRFLKKLFITFLNSIWFDWLLYILSWICSFIIVYLVLTYRYLWQNLDENYVLFDQEYQEYFIYFQFIWYVDTTIVCVLTDLYNFVLYLPIILEYIIYVLKLIFVYGLKFRDLKIFFYWFLEKSGILEWAPLFFFGLTFFLSSTVSSLFFMSHLGLYGVFFINFITIVIFWLTTIIYFNSFFYENLSIHINVFKWFAVMDGFNIDFEFFIDSISYSFMLLTVTIATAVYPYVYSYFRYEPNIERLSLLINLFVISMVVLVISGNFFVLFFGWEMIGITSFLLINFWSTKISSLKSAFKAYTFNKLSDLTLFIGLLYSFLIIEDSNLEVFNFQISEYWDYYVTIICIDIDVVEFLSFLFIISAFVKSAQFGFHIWLPDSMDAPVPASALIHSATLVSAGVFLLLRLTPLYELSIYSAYIIPLIGSFTAFLGGLCASYQSDIKRILAYSTISHCGFLMLCFSLYIPEYTILYLYVHGFFKAAVFLCAGNIIRFSRNYQDFRKMGLFWNYLPFEFYCSLLCLSNLCGLPFTFGFFIKHLILLVLDNNFLLSIFVLTNVLGGAVFGLIYSYKFFFYIFLDKKKISKYLYKEVNRFELSSKFYSNTTLVPILSISFLITVSFVIVSLLFNCFLKKESVSESLDIYNFVHFFYLEYLWPSRIFLRNISYFNWLLFIILISLICIQWRITFKSYILIFLLNLTFLFIVSLFYCYLI